MTGRHAQELDLGYGELDYAPVRPGTVTGSYGRDCFYDNADGRLFSANGRILCADGSHVVGSIDCIKGRIRFNRLHASREASVSYCFDSKCGRNLPRYIY